MRWIKKFVSDDDNYNFSVQKFDMNRCYRIFTSFTATDPISKREDIPTTYQRAIKYAPGKCRFETTPCFRLFYKGSEEELNRYLRWLREVYLEQDTDAPAPVYVLMQDTHIAQEELAMLYPNFDTYFVGPGQLEHFGLLTGKFETVETKGLY